MALGTIGSGLDIPSLVSQLVAKEREPREKQINTAGVAASATQTVTSSKVLRLVSSLRRMAGSIDD